MKRIPLLLIIAAVAATSLIPVSSASAAPKPSAEILGTVVTADGGETATVTARYTCYEETHLWVSAKQMDDGRRDPALLGGTARRSARGPCAAGRPSCSSA